MKDSKFDFQIVKKEASYDVHLKVDGSDPQIGKFEFDLDPASRLAQVIRDIEANNCNNDNLRDVGSHLWIALVENEIGEFFKQRRKEAEVAGKRLIFRLTLPPDLEKLPWESLYDEIGSGFLAINPNTAIIRTPPPGVQTYTKDDTESDKLRILVAIPEGSGLQADHEWQRMATVAEKLGNIVEMERLQGRVTPDRILAELNRKPWDILHFIGHGEVDDADIVSIRLNSDNQRDDELWVEGETFAEMFRDASVRLVVLNCCLGAMPNPLRTLSGLGPYLLRAGVPCVVAMRYEIPDEVAIRFSGEFYHQLLNGRESGRVDSAVQRARRSLHMYSTESKTRGFVTPVLYVAQDQEQLFQVQGSQPATIPGPLPSEILPGNIPEELADVFRENLCIPVIGPGILGAGTVRRGMPGLDPAQLAELLAQESSYPRSGDFEAVKSTGDWLRSSLFQCVCQHYQYRHKRFKLVRTIQKIYEKAEPPQSLMNIASWKVPGIIYTYIDGLMEEALRRSDKSMRTLIDLTQEIDVDPSIPLLVLLRGSFTDINSLILTEDDHDRLWQNLGKMCSSIISLTREELGRSLLLLGVNPRDPVIRRICTQLLDSGVTRNQGPTFFVWPDHTEADQAYWEKFDIQWIDDDLNDFICALSSVSQGGP